MNSNGPGDETETQVTPGEEQRAVEAAEKEAEGGPELVAARMRRAGGAGEAAAKDQAVARWGADTTARATARAAAGRMAKGEGRGGRAEKRGGCRFPSLPVWGGGLVSILPSIFNMRF